MGASSRVRFYQYVPLLKDAGIDVSVSPLFRDSYLTRLYSGEETRWREIVIDYLSRAYRLVAGGAFDLLWLEKELFPGLPALGETTLRSLGRRLVVDYDDAVFLNYEHLCSYPARLFCKKIDSVMRSATVVTAGNSWLADRAHSVGSRYTEVIPTVVDTRRYLAVDSPRRNCVVVGWMGTRSTSKYLELVAPALSMLSTEYPICLRVIGAEFAAKGVRCELRPWSESTEVAELQDIDIGIMPLHNTPWERGKCGYKLIQYMACGKPVIGSPVGANGDIIDHGVNGFLAENTDTWYSAFRLLCAEPARRRTMGRAGRARVEQKYSLDATAQILAGLFRRVASREIA